jgi:hypothetical protein
MFQFKPNEIVYIKPKKVPPVRCTQCDVLLDGQPTPPLTEGLFGYEPEHGWFSTAIIKGKITARISLFGRQGYIVQIGWRIWTAGVKKYPIAVFLTNDDLMYTDGLSQAIRRAKGRWGQ